VAFVSESERIIRALRTMPIPQPRPGFVERALKNATRVTSGDSIPSRDWCHVMARWETWFGAALGAAAAAAVTFMLMRPIDSGVPEPTIRLALDEARDIDVLITADRDMRDATIRIAVTGAVALDGFANDHIVDWRSDLERGTNLLSLPVIARKTGDGQLVAVIEHGGKARTVTIDLSVVDSGAKRS
jgi:hypothetical protein